MKNILQQLSLGLFVVTLSSCVDAGGYVSTRPGLRSYHNNGDFSNGYYGHHHPGYYQSRPAPAGVNARVNARVLPLNVYSSTNLGLF